MVTFSSFLPLLNLSCTCFSSFTANTLLVQYVHNGLCKSLSLSVPVSRFFFFLHRFATVRFGVLLWRPGFMSWFQFGD